MREDEVKGEQYPFGETPTEDEVCRLYVLKM